MIRILHWSLVFSIVLAYSTAYYRYWYTSQTEVANWYLLVLHINLGLLILMLTSIMLILRYRLSKEVNSSPQHRSTSADIMHKALYFMMISIPISAYIGTGIDIPLLGIVNLPGFFRNEFIQHFVQQNFDMLMITFIEPFADYHRDIGTDYILPILFVGHLGAAIYHLKLKLKI